MAINKFLTLEGLTYFWGKIKAYCATKQEVQEATKTLQTAISKTSGTYATNNKTIPAAGGDVAKADIIGGDVVKVGDLILDNAGNVFTVTAVGEKITVGAAKFSLKGVTGDKGEKGDTGKGFYVSATNIGSNTDVPKTDIANANDIKVGDIIVDVNGEVYQVSKVTADKATVGGVILNLKGAVGAKGKGISVTNNITIKNNTINKTDVVNANNVAVHDYLLDNTGKVYEVTAITDTAFNTGNALFSIQGAQGIQGEKGDPFTVKKTYETIEAMNNDFANAESPVKEGDFVIISTTDVNNEDNAKLYVKGAKAFTFITDLSGAQGIKGDTGYSVLMANKEIADDATTVPKADVDNADSLKVGDHILNTNGLIFKVTGTDGDNITVAPTTTNLATQYGVITNEEIDALFNE